ncbi:MAG: AAA family ATPase [Rhodospirillales bacterium]|nr:AAA family ATPase [Rhodospirillales bacterium]
MSYKPQDALIEEEITEDVAAYIDSVVERLQEAKAELSRAVLGQPELLEDFIITLLSGGNLVVEGMPGTAKTVLVEAIGQVFGLDSKRIQCTPDLLPQDITGNEIVKRDPTSGELSYEFMPGPIFAQLVMADEINRTPGKTQSAFLEAMQEKKVTVGGHRHILPKPFFVLATQNPVEQEGTYPLPEAQLDRFLMKAHVHYPDRESEKTIARETTTTHHSWKEIMDESIDLEAPGSTLVSPKDLKQVFNEKSLIHAQHLVRKLAIGDKPLNAILDIVRNARPNMRDKQANEVETEDMQELLDFVDDHVEYGPGTRALQAFALATRARALMRGDLQPNIEDVKALAKPILRHRIRANMSAKLGQDGIDEDKIIERLTLKM